MLGKILRDALKIIDILHHSGWLATGHGTYNFYRRLLANRIMMHNDQGAEIM